MNKKNCCSDRLNLSKMQNCGLVATIIKYNNANDIDVQFENGVIKEHRTYLEFERGRIRYLSRTEKTAIEKQEREGLTRQMNCGLNATIIKYNNAEDIDVQFEDGTVVKHRRYDHFLDGGIHCPSIDKKLLFRESVIGLKVKQHCGLEAEIIDYANSKNITVKFEDGAIRKHVQLHSFRVGEVAHPAQRPVYDKSARLGMKNITNDGLEIQITAYRGATDIDVTFLIDGTVVKTSFLNFKRGSLLHPIIKPTHNISIQEFAINYYLQKYGFVKINQSQWADRGFGKFELDFYHEEKNIAIEYDGNIHNKPSSVKIDIRKNKKCKEFGITLYRLREFSLPILTDGNSINYVLKKENHLMRCMNNCKAELEEILTKHDIPFGKDDIDFVRDQNMLLQLYHQTTISYYRNLHLNEIANSKKHNQQLKIIDYHSFDNIDVEFLRDGVILYGASYSNFKKDTLPHPSRRKKDFSKTRVGEKRMMNNGHECEITRYGDYTDIDVVFDDGTEIKNKTYYAFLHGQIDFMTADEKRNSHIGETVVLNDGTVAEIIEFPSSTDITIRFSDGSIREHMLYSCFIRKQIQPVSFEEKRNSHIGETRTMKDGSVATIINIHGNLKDIDLKFEDGSIKEHQEYGAFKKGELTNPNKKARQYAAHIGEKRMLKCGLEAEIINYQGTQNVTIKFSDGTIKEHVQYYSFVHGTVSHPSKRSKQSPSQ